MMKSNANKHTVTILLIINLTFLSFSRSDPLTLTSAEMIEGILGQNYHRDEMNRLNHLITAALADHRLNDQTIRHKLAEWQDVLNEMLDQRLGTNVGKLIEFAKWMEDQSLEQISIHYADADTTPQQQFILDNPLAGQYVFLTSIIYQILFWYICLNGEGAEVSHIEAFLDLYLHFRHVAEGANNIPFRLMLSAPNWLQSRFQQLSLDQKRLFLEDVQVGLQLRALPPHPDEVVDESSPCSEIDNTAFEAVYQFILNNTPQP